MNIDIIVCWPRNNDYPLWRQFIRDNRSRFNEIIIAFTETNQGDDYREFVKAAMFADHVQFVDIQPVRADEDWRNIAINAALLHSYNAEWIWFTEQDFTPKAGFWNDAQMFSSKGAKVIGIDEGGRIHPASLLMHRDILSQNQWDFGIIPDKSDHFSKVTNKLKEMGIKIELIPQISWEHLSGLSQNFTLLMQKQTPNWQIRRFNQYLKDCLSVKVPLADLWVGIVRAYLAGFPE